MIDRDDTTFFIKNNRLRWILESINTIRRWKYTTDPITFDEYSAWEFNYIKGEISTIIGQFKCL